MAQESKSSVSDMVRRIESLSVAELDEVIAAAEHQREARRESGKKELIEEFRARAEALGVSLRDLVAGPAEAKRAAGATQASRRGPAGRRVAAKYRNPVTGDTWSGRGRVPNWLKLAEQQGRTRDEFAAGA